MIIPYDLTGWLRGANGRTYVSHVYCANAKGEHWVGDSEEKEKTCCMFADFFPPRLVLS